ncbi:MAG: histidine--tRNA ligase [Candidatus Omnitrophica bacterium]|nr:histidine--tRNA ligase [Candidatus Omnitrophota bacterium]
MEIKAIRGTKDILPKNSQIWCFIEGKAKGLCELYGYRQIRTPLLEEARLFARSIGEATDIVQKEMYSFLDRKKRLLCLRPEATASVVRAYLEHGLDKSAHLAKFYYFGPMFRAERPQAGRLRQFHHIGVEAIGSLSPYLDAEVISLAVKILQEIGLEGFSVQLNSIGCRKDRQKYKLILRKALKNKLKLLCCDCHSRYKVNLLRIFDCKNVACKKVTRRLPSIVDSLCPQCRGHFFKVKQILNSLNISYTLNPHLVRGLDYYTKTCFEFVHPHLGAQNAVGAGGRYDDLVSDLGGPEKPAVGFALGIERLIAAIAPGKEAEQANKIFPSLYVAVIGDEARQLAFKTLHSLREQGIFCEMDYHDKSLKGQMRQADKLRAKYVAILGETELKKEVVILRDMQNKSQKEVKIDKLAEELK